MSLPRMLRIHQHFPDRAVKDIPGTIAAELRRADFASKLKPGSRVAIGVGSRGIANIATIVRAVVDYWKSVGMNPFIFPAMGSHGAASPEGQAMVLGKYKITEETMGCAILSQLEVVSLGVTPEGITAYLDKSAYESDGVMLVGRVKWHTDFEGPIESGLYKMMAIGLGKFAGAQYYHTFAYKIGLGAMLRAVGRQVLKSGKILGGLAILEDANHTTAQLTAVPVETMEEEEQKLLALAKSWQGHVPVKELDILIIDEIGKDISGAGMDTKVVNRGVNGEYNCWQGPPKFHRIFVRDLTRNTYGSAVGMGMADVINSRILPQIDWAPTQINSLTASSPAAIRTPVYFDTDRECLERFLPTVGKHDLSKVTIGRILNTLSLVDLELSENLRPEIEANPNLRIVEGPYDFPVDEKGQMSRLGGGDGH
ncbi:MAG: nickel-dependent lactate racemase [Bryobacter sp.]|nr:nickel-dependent lactate racemase [Bryobacter sp. CoA8 C33]